MRECNTMRVVAHFLIQLVCHAVGVRVQVKTNASMTPHGLTIEQLDAQVVSSKRI